MGLDASRSLALFVSGWGLDGTGEAILYVTRRSDGSLYWYGVLIAPTRVRLQLHSGLARSVLCRHAHPRADRAAEGKHEPIEWRRCCGAGQSNPRSGCAAVGIFAPVNFDSSTARTVFTSADSYNWGGGPSGAPDVGSFKDIIQPKLLEVLNAPNMETYCDELTKVFPLATPWPYPDIRYYNLYKPSTTDISTLISVPG